MLRLRLPITLLIAALLLIPAAHARTLPGLVQLGIGIGKVRLGMPAAEARRILKTTGVEVRIRNIGVRPGIRYLAYEYRPTSISGPNYILAIQGPVGSRKVVRVYTFTAANPTPQGIRVNSTEAQLLARYGPQLSCRRVWDRLGGSWACALGDTSRRHTVFSLVENDVTDPNSIRRVEKIFVQEPRLVVSP